MRIKLLLPVVVAVLVSAIMPALGLAQNIGFQIGIARPQFVLPPVQAPAIAVRSTFMATPAPVVPPPQIAVPLVPNFPTVIVPNQVLVPGQTMFPVNPIVPGLLQVPPLRHVPPVAGTPRADVLRQFGQPSVTVVTSAGETLFFPGGVTIILHNGLVAGSR